MDPWALLLGRFGIPSLNFASLGRWLGHVPDGKRIQANIAKATPVKGELLIGWCVHHSIGISFAQVLLTCFGLNWAHSPTRLRNCIKSVVTHTVYGFGLYLAALATASLIPAGR
jgi:hypothetical protein